jgi:hypothetical protein
MDNTSPHVISEHLNDEGIRLAASLAALDRADALYILDFASIIVERFFEERALSPKWRKPRLRIVGSTRHHPTKRPAKGAQNTLADLTTQRMGVRKMADRNNITVADEPVGAGGAEGRPT